MTHLWDKIRYFGAMTLIICSLLFSAAIWSTPPSLAYLAILISSPFAFLMTLLWIVTFPRTKYAWIIIAINTLVCLISVGFLFLTSGGFEDYQHYVNSIGNILAASLTVPLGIANFKILNALNGKAKESI